MSVLAIVLRFTLCVLVLLAVVWLAREVLRLIQRSHHRNPPPPSPAVAELELRYARGEINRADYLGRRADLGGPPPAAPIA
ncbi:MAG: SHOCT domain-containing protein [Candidatus Dormibacter sp.]